MASKLSALKKRVADGYKARAQLEEIENKSKTARHRKLIGQCFKYRNCYSCPKDSSDYWWLYRRVVSVDGDWCEAFDFQTDQYGKTEFELRKSSIGGLGAPITAAEYEAAFADAMLHVSVLHKRSSGKGDGAK